MALDRTSLAQRAAAAADAINRDDIDAFLELMHPDVEFESLIAEADGEVFHGHDGVRRWWAGIRDAFQDGHWEYRSIDVDATGERGVAEVHIVGTLAGVRVEQTMWQAVALRDELAVWWRFFRTRAEARAAAGLDAPGDGAAR